MNDFTTEIVQTLVTKGDLNELFRSHLEKAINTLLRTELTAFLDYEKYDRTGFNSGNSRNGSYFRSIKTEYGELTLEIPMRILHCLIPDLHPIALDKYHPSLQ